MTFRFLLFVLSIIYVNGQFTCDPAADCALPSAPTVVPDPNNCRNFYRCVDGVNEDTSLTCGDSAYFNGDVDNPACITGDCTAPSCPGFSPKCKTSCAELDEGTEGFIAYPGDCESAFYCSTAGTFHVVNCPGQFFDGEGCTDIEADGCCSICGPPICPEGIGMDTNFPDKTSCSYYYMCLDGGALQQPCPNDLIFDMITATCTAADDATCEVYCLDDANSTSF